MAGNLKSLASDHKTYALAMAKWFGRHRLRRNDSLRLASDVKRKTFYPFFDT